MTNISIPVVIISKSTSKNLDSFLRKEIFMVEEPLIIYRVGRDEKDWLKAGVISSRIALIRAKKDYRRIYGNTRTVVDVRLVENEYIWKEKNLNKIK